jgi:hypothetical protein
MLVRSTGVAHAGSILCRFQFSWCGLVALQIRVVCASPYTTLGQRVTREMTTILCPEKRCERDFWLRKWTFYFDVAGVTGQGQVSDRWRALNGEFSMT